MSMEEGGKEEGGREEGIVEVLLTSHIPRFTFLAVLGQKPYL